MIDSTNAWTPYVASNDDPWDLRKVAHLHRRAGFSASWQQLQRDVDTGPAECIDRLVQPLVESPAFQQVSDAMLHAAGGTEDSDSFSSDRDASRAAAWWLFRMAYGPDPLGEKLTLFWHNHFATALRGVYSMPLMLRQNATLRKYARGNFSEILKAVEADPAMLVWLDGGRNHKDHPNENFAREMLELFTLGIGSYSETDVRAAARGLTGWKAGRDNLLRSTNEFTYRDELADVGEKTFLGKTGPWQTPDILRIVLQQPVAAEHLCRRLYRWFVDELTDPSDEIIQPLATEFRASNYSTQHVVGIILRSRLFYSRAMYRRRVKSPVEYCVGVIRQLEPERSPNLLQLTAMSCERQGQKLFDPPSVKGWDGGRAWLNTNTALERMNWMVDVLQGNPRAALPKYDPEKWINSHALDTTNAAGTYRELLLGDNVDEPTFHQIRALSQSGRSDSLLATLHVLAQSPEYQLE